MDVSITEPVYLYVFKTRPIPVPVACHLSPVLPVHRSPVGQQVKTQVQF